MPFSTTIEVVTNEFISIVDYLVKTKASENNRLILEKELFKKLLEKNAYLKFSEKTKIYKQLNFIIHDKNSYTLPYKCKETKKTVRKVVINLETYKLIKHLAKNIIT